VFRRLGQRGEQSDDRRLGLAPGVSKIEDHGNVTVVHGDSADLDQLADALL